MPAKRERKKDRFQSRKCTLRIVILQRICVSRSVAATANEVVPVAEGSSISLATSFVETFRGECQRDKMKAGISQYLRCYCN